MNHSTGPRTPEGKQRTRLNALRHGLTGQTVLLPTDDAQAYQSFCDEFTVHYQPVGPVERQLVQTIADTGWRLNRISAMEHSSLSLAAAQKLDQMQTTDNPSAQAIAQALAFQEQSDRLAKLSLYEQRLSRQLDRSFKLIKEIQADRRQQAKQEPAQTAATAKPQPAQKPHLAKQPPAREFVFSTPTNTSIPPQLVTEKEPEIAMAA